MGFGDTKAAHDTLILAQPNDVFEIEVKKNDRGYNDWVSAVKSNGASTATTATSAPTRAPTTTAGTTSPKSTYETPEERAKKQIYIVRQSSISSAIDLLSVGQKSPPDVDKVLEAASRFEEFVFGNKVSDAEVAGSFFPDQVKQDFTTDFDDIPL